MLVALLVSPMLIMSTSFVTASLPPPTEWSKPFGKTNDEKAYSVVETSDGGFVIAGENDTDGNGNLDAFLLKTYSNGTLIWSYNYGDLPQIGQTGIEWVRAVIECDNGDFVFAGSRNIDLHGETNNFWLVRTNSTGFELWDEQIGGFGGDYANSIIETNDGGFAMAGASTSFGGGHTSRPTNHM